MTSRGPLLTLLAVVLVGGIVFAANVAGRPTPGTASAGPGATGAATSAAAVATSVVAPATPSVVPPVAPVVEEAVFAGRSADRTTTIAVAVKNGRAIAYVCDGRKVEAWLDGTLVGNRLELSGKDGASVSGSASPDSATGTIVVGTRRLAFTARAAGKPAGLYEGRADVRGVVNRIGWIVLPDGTQVGIRNVGAGSGLEPAPVLDPTRLDGVVLDGTPVPVHALSGADTVRTG